MRKYPTGGRPPVGENEEAMVSQAKTFMSVRFLLAATVR